MTPPMLIDDARFVVIVDMLDRAGFAKADIDWSENAGPPKDAEDFASEAVFVICNSGMKNTVARGIFERVMAYIPRGGSAFDAFRHPGKAAAIDLIWTGREALFQAYMAADDKLAFCESLPWIGPVTKFHLAKNFGLDVAKPDVHLQRLADLHGCTAQALCERLAVARGWKARTVDVLLWRACAIGVLDGRTGAISAPRGGA